MSCFAPLTSTSNRRTSSCTRVEAVDACSVTLGWPAMVSGVPPLSWETGTSYVARLPGTSGDSGGTGNGRSSRAPSMTSGSQKNPLAGSVTGFTSTAGASNEVLTVSVASASSVGATTTFDDEKASSRGRVSAAYTTAGGALPSSFR